MMNDTPIGALALTLLLAACGSGGDEQKAAGGPPPAMAVQVHVLQGRPLENAFSTTGTLLPNEEVELRSEVSGRVTHIGFQEGTRVSAGQVLVRINDDDLQAQLRKAEAALKVARDSEERQKQLLDVEGVSREVYDATVSQRIGMEADVDHLRAQIAKTTIRAPFSGSIGLRSISEGGYVSPTALIARLTQTDPMKLDFTVPERYGRQMRPGTQVAFSLEGDTTHYTAEVYAVEPSVDATTRTVRVRARSANKEGRLMPGAFAKVDVKLETIADALTIPAEALIPDIQGQKVMVMKGGKAQSVRVDIGIRTENEVQLISNVQPGDTVITSALLAVRDGMPVRPAAMKGSTSGTDTTRTGN
jgi:membrane fusion protein (multidrug efflux system)